MTKETKADQTGREVLVLLGGAGDLALRMLLPSLYFLEVDRLLPHDLRIISLARHDYDEKRYEALVLEHLCKRVNIDDSAWNRLAARIDYLSVDITTEKGAAKLAEKIGDHGDLVVYFALSPSLYGPVCNALQSAGLTGPRTRLVLEKPIGRDLESSRATNAAVGAVVSESQIFRIDHYLGKETVQNLTALRFANVLFEPLWDNKHIDHVQITIAETEKVGERWPYYDEYGALRDMLQNHLLQLLCLVAMEPPSGFDPDAMRDEKVKVLRSLRPFTKANVAHDTVRGQYVAGVVEGTAREGYLEEVGKPSRTETFVALKVDIDNWRWAGVPFFLRTGKNLPDRRTQIVVQFKATPHNIFGAATKHELKANRLVIYLQPQEDISLTVMTRRPALSEEGMRLQALPLSLNMAAPGSRRRIAYEKLLLDVFRGDRTLFVRRDEVEQAWQFVDGVSAAWAEAKIEPAPYAAGTWGPHGATALIAPQGRAWNE
ncbi:glucose-6-phosphate dehydrogenase [Caulobacter sp. Root1455]|uniref:glucose-6-phosphate dehydrogenase n=1 Tax=unclassified Caulobacter TaxID=2648921 RepID=UPI0006F30426|nr:MULTISPECIES: glucose-6-phosphate dehydrogenase [unclassified Caulobacter]KQY30940.1 glucose-6-phosphate dehydrogenase [Caulobacter sp. Root487D2Y]KQY95232.1 glucose-6-phosphate dehydrogenase [Caulobacter sp. Root1455]